MSDDEGYAPAAQMLICFIFPACVQKNTDADDRCHREAVQFRKRFLTAYTLRFLMVLRALQCGQAPGTLNWPSGRTHDNRRNERSSLSSSRRSTQSGMGPSRTFDVSYTGVSLGSEHRTYFIKGYRVIT
jgi:hypothetical protein